MSENRGNKHKRTLTNEDLKRYDAMVEMVLRDSVVKNWNEASTAKHLGEVSLGNTGLTINDIRQHLKVEVCIALHNYNPEYRTKEGRSVKESTFVHTHLFNRVGQLMKRFTKRKYGYGIRHSNLEETFHEIDAEE